MAFKSGKSFLKKIKRYFNDAYKSGHYPALVDLLRNRGKILAYRGFLGDGNYGDELVFEASKSLLTPCLLMPMYRRKPIITGLLIRFGLIKFRGEVLGGGTLIGPRNELNGKAKVIFIHGTGVRDEYSNDWINVMHEQTVFGGVRGAGSHARLKDKGWEIKVHGDAAFAFFDEGLFNSAKNPRSILINMGMHHDESGLVQSRKEMRLFVEMVLEKGMSVEYLPFHTRDIELGRELCRQYPNVKLHSIPENFQSAQKVFNGVSFAVGERLHFAVIALLCKVPFLSVMYDSKHEDLLESVDASFSGAFPADVSCKDLFNRYTDREKFPWDSVRSKLSSYQHIQVLDARAFLSYIKLGVLENQH
jgi:hypothetical protein